MAPAAGRQFIGMEVIVDRKPLGQRDRSASALGEMRRHDAEPTRHQIQHHVAGIRVGGRPPREFAMARQAHGEVDIAIEARDVLRNRVRCSGKVGSTSDRWFGNAQDPSSATACAPPIRTPAPNTALEAARRGALRPFVPRSIGQGSGNCTPPTNEPIVYKHTVNLAEPAPTLRLGRCSTSSSHRSFLQLDSAKCNGRRSASAGAIAARYHRLLHRSFQPLP